ncbi:hypothetical protein EWG08_12845 [Salmonella enterica subsp. enterica serovar Reading]|nr:hypothetical protein [Salmonella enterica subsp. enterica serovar Reading]
MLMIQIRSRASYRTQFCVVGNINNLARKYAKRLQPSNLRFACFLIDYGKAHFWAVEKINELSHQQPGSKLSRLLINELAHEQTKQLRNSILSFACLSTGKDNHPPH